MDFGLSNELVLSTLKLELGVVYEESMYDQSHFLSLIRKETLRGGGFDVASFLSFSDDEFYSVFFS